MFLNQVLELEKSSLKPLKVYLHTFSSLFLRVCGYLVYKLRKPLHVLLLKPTDPRKSQIRKKLSSRSPAGRIFSQLEASRGVISSSFISPLMELIPWSMDLKSLHERNPFSYKLSSSFRLKGRLYRDCRC